MSLERLRERADRTSAAFLHGGRSTWWSVFAAAAVVFLWSAHWSVQNTDAVGAALPAWHLLRTGELDLRLVEDVAHFPGAVDTGERVVVARTVGVLLVAFLGQLPLAALPVEPEAGSALAAALLAAAALANTALALRSLVSPVAALVGAAVLGLGTAVWTVASAELWSHSPDVLLLSLVLLALSRDRLWWAGAAFGAAVLCRPHLALSAAVLGLALAWSRRSLRPLPALGLPTAAGAVLLVAANAWYFGAPSLGGGYSLGAVTPPAPPPAVSAGDAVAPPAVLPPQVVDVPAEASRWRNLVPEQGLENLLGTLVSPMSGLFLYSPVVLVLLLAVVRHRAAAPAWTRAAALAGLAYLLAQMAISGSFDGGAGYFGNRYTLEPLVLATPLLAACGAAWARASERARLALLVSAAASVAVHLYGVLMYSHLLGTGVRSSWTVWYPWFIGVRAGAAGWASAAVACWLGLGVVVAAQALRRTPPGVIPAQRASARAEPLVRS